MCAIPMRANQHSFEVGRMEASLAGFRHKQGGRSMSGPVASHLFLESDQVIHLL
jgi:hypothetical protein